MNTNRYTVIAIPPAVTVWHHQHTGVNSQCNTDNFARPDLVLYTLPSLNACEVFENSLRAGVVRLGDTHASITEMEQIRIAMNEVEAAQALGMSIHFLRKDRITKRIIPFYKLGDRVLYSPERIKQALAGLEEGGNNRSKKS